MRTELTIDEIHNETLEVLEKIMDICDRLNIKYYMYYGSLLGAVRHSGFIPWDDDLDIAMKREDYEKFISYCKRNEKELYPFQLINKENTRGYPFNISRFCDMRYIMESKYINNVEMGLFIDIYPLDGVKKRKYTEKVLLYIKKFLMYYNIACNMDSFIPTNKGCIHNILLYGQYKLAKIFGTEYWLNKFDELRDIFIDNHSSYVTCIQWDDNSIYSKDCFDEVIYTKFENLVVMIPKGYDTLLTQWYGDYMKLPPEDKRIATHNYKLYRK